jgi:hypothetical protein
VNEDDKPGLTSGSRWEPPTTPGAAAPDMSGTAPATDVPAASDASGTAETPTGAPPPPRPARTGRRRAPLACAALALVAGGGVGGFAVASAAGSDAGDTGVVQDDAVPGPRGGDGHGFPPGSDDGSTGDGRVDDGAADDGDGTT